MTEQSHDVQQFCQCGNAVKPFFRRMFVSGVGEVVSAKPEWGTRCERCILKPALAKRQAERVGK